MKIKIIDLVNKIINDELEDGFKILIDGNFVSVYNREDRAFKTESGCFNYIKFEYFNLNKEVEIIEEDKEIDFIEIYYDNDVEEYVAETFTNNNLYKEICNSKYDEMIIYKINELIKEVKELKKEGK